MAGPPPGQDPSDITYSEYPSPSAPQGGFTRPLEIDQQVDMAMEEPFYSRNGDLPVNPIGHYEGESPYVNTSMNPYQLNPPSGMPTSINHRIFATLQEMGWTGND